MVRFLHQSSKPDQTEFKEYHHRIICAKQLLGQFSSPRDKSWRSHIHKQKQGDYIGYRRGLMTGLPQAWTVPKNGQILNILSWDLSGWQH